MLKKLLKKFSMCLCFIFIMTTLFNIPEIQVVYATDEYDNLRLKYLEFITGGTEYNPNDAVIAAKIHLIEADTEKYWGLMNADKTWDDCVAASLTDPGYINTISKRLKVMASGWATYGSSFYGNSDLLNDIKSGLDWLYTNRYNENITSYGNWWGWQIGVPKDLEDTTIMLYDRLSSIQKNNYMNAINHFTPTVSMTSANRADVSMIVALQGIIIKNPLKIKEGSDGLDDCFPYVTSGNGFYEDGSYIDHWYSATSGGFPYLGGYGEALLMSTSRLMWLLSGSSWDNDSPDKNNVYEWIFKSVEPNLYKGQKLHAVRGRSIAGKNDAYLTGGAILASLSLFIELSGNPYVDDMKSLLKYHLQISDESTYYSSYVNIWGYTRTKAIMDDAAVAARSELTGNFQFYNQDTAVHRRPEWTFALRMHSSRVANVESFNGDNVRGWYQADGMTYLYTDPLDYVSNFFFAADHHRMPGTTVDRDLNRPDASNGTRSSKDFVGGVEFEKTFGLSSMDFQQHNYSNMNVSAKKSWFMFDDEVVALGAGINSTSGRTIETVVENRAINSNGSNTLIVNGIEKPVNNGWSESMNNVDWAYLEGTGGYYFPGGTTLKGLREERVQHISSMNTITTFSDQFNSTILNAEWGWVREDNSKWSLNGTEICLSTQNGTLAGTLNTSKNILLKNVPTGDYVITTRLNFSPTREDQEAGLIIYFDDDNYLYLSKAYTSSGNKFLAVNENGAIQAINSIDDSFGSVVYLKIDKSGDSYSMYVSSDGTNWGSPVYTYAHQFSTIPVKLGVFAQNGNTQAPDIDATFDFVDIKVVKNFITMWYDHGINPENQSYSYVMLPKMTNSQVSTYASNPDIQVVKNTTSVQAVKETTLGLLGATFWEDTGDSVEYISSHSAASIIAKDTGSQLTIAVSDPTHKQSVVTVELNKSGVSLISNDPQITVLQLTPTIKFEVDVSGKTGKTYTAKFSYNGNVAVPPNTPTGLGAVQNSTSVSLNWDSVLNASSYEVYKSRVGGSGYSLLKSGLTSPGYTDTSAPAGSAYYYMVKAVNSIGSSGFSEEVNSDISILQMIPVEDSYVRGGSYAEINYGTSTVMVVKNAPDASYTRESYLKFDLSKVTGTNIASAKLYIYGKADDSNGTNTDIKAYGVDNDTWSETGITWNNRPLPSSLQSTVNVDNTANAWRAFDVTPYVQEQYSGDKTVSLCLKEDVAAGLSCTLYSKESGASVRPYLKIEYYKEARLDVSADTYVRGGTYAGTNYGTQTNLYVKNVPDLSYTREAYLKFGLNSINSVGNINISSAKLYIYGKVDDTNGTNVDVKAYGVDTDSWTETGLTWSDKPTLAGLQSTVNIDSAAGKWREFDVTTYIQAQYAGDKIASICLKEDTTAGLSCTLYSRESNSKPYIQVQYRYN